MNEKQQSEVLLEELLIFAQKMLGSHGEFHPFGVYMKPTGEVVHVGVQVDLGRVSSQQRLDSLGDALKKIALQSTVIAVGIASNVTLSRKDGRHVDAIKCFLEHRDGYCADVFTCYELEAAEVKISDTSAQQGRPSVFTKAQ